MFSIGLLREQQPYFMRGVQKNEENKIIHLNDCDRSAFDCVGTIRLA